MAAPGKVTPPPGYQARLPLLPPVRSLKRDLGVVDASSQVAQLAFDSLRERVEAAPDPRALLEELAAKYNLPPGTDQLDVVERQLAMSHVFHAHAVIDQFLKQVIHWLKYFRPELRTWKKKKRSTDTNDADALEQLAINLKGNRPSPLRQAPEFELLHYFRHIRHYAGHQSSVALGQAETAHHQLDSAFFTQNYGHAPNLPSALVFADFLVYTRATKYFAQLLNDACECNLDRIVRAMADDADLRSRVASHVRGGALNKARLIVRQVYRERHGGGQRTLYEQFVERLQKDDFAELFGSQTSA